MTGSPMKHLFALAAFTILAAPLAAAPKVTSIFKPGAEGEIVKLDQQGRLELKVAGSDVAERVPLDEIEEISMGLSAVERKPDETPLRLVLTNGDLLFGAPLDDPGGADDLFKFTSPRLGELTVGIEHVRRIESVRNVKPGVLAELDANAKYDCAYFAAEGDKREESDPRAELVRIGKDGINIYNDLINGEKYEGDKYPWSRLRGVVCKREAFAASNELTGIFTLRDGTILRGKVKAWGGGEIVVVHPLLKEIKLSERNVMTVTFKNGRYVYLSDMEFGKTPEERPYYLPADFKPEDHLFKVKRDSAQGGSPISIRGKVYAKGLGVHAISKLTFNLRKGYSKLVGIAGVDDSAGDLASVEFKIYGDGKLLYESGVLRRSSSEKAIDISLVNVEELVLEVTAADNADVQDRANWANIKVVR
ncbi:MAG: NPCBM/NEW2 domain-containing protein [Planctomycetes bacterium]|nr:NPCBM/NEW2 domain-containing protein [Planctomycetota bacterium]